ncbi:MAG: hypothetical protein AB7K24_30135 [Gemmataceae bacterium]
MYPALLVAVLPFHPGVVDVDQFEFSRSTFVFNAHGHGVAAAGGQVCILMDDGTATPPNYEMFLFVRVVSADSYVDGRILMTRVKVEVTPKQYRKLALARRHGKIIIMPPPPNEGGGGVDPEFLNRRLR